MSYLWKSKTQPLICGKHRTRTNLQEESCSSHQTKAQRFLWLWACKLCKHFFTQNLVACGWKRKTYYPKQVSLKPLLPFSCEMKAEVSFIIMWHPKCWFSTWSFLNIFCTHDNLQFLRMFLSTLQATANTSQLNLDNYIFQKGNLSSFSTKQMN